MHENDDRSLLSREAWERSVRATLVGVTPAIRPELPFEGTFAALSFGSGRLCTVSSRPLVVGRKVVGRDATSETVNLLVLLEGSALVRHCSQRAQLHAGDMLVLDGVHDFSAQMVTDYRQVLLQFPRELLGRRHAGLLRQAGVRLDGGEPAMALVRQVAELVAQSAGALDHAQRCYAFDAFVTLLGMLPAAERGLRSTGAERISRALADMEARLADPGLSAEQLAGLQGISRRRLDALFAERGLSIQKLIWERRLERAALEIASAGATFRSLLEIAVSWGFSSEAHFSRRFRVKFGMSPGRYRKAVPAMPTPR